jgi:TPR repeat protein
VNRISGERQKLYESSCERGVPQACRRLSILYAAGAGVPKDEAKARNLREKACTGGYEVACRELGRGLKTQGQATQPIPE